MSLVYIESYLSVRLYAVQWFFNVKDFTHSIPLRQNAASNSAKAENGVTVDLPPPQQ